MQLKNPDAPTFPALSPAIQKHVPLLKLPHRLLPRCHCSSLSSDGMLAPRPSLFKSFAHSKVQIRKHQLILSFRRALFLPGSPKCSDSLHLTAPEQSASQCAPLPLPLGCIFHGGCFPLIISESLRLKPGILADICCIQMWNLIQMITKSQTMIQ